MYWVEDYTTGNCVSGASCYEEALVMQENAWKQGIDTYIIKG